MNSILTKEEIRAIFIANGFTVKPGNDDLKDYVYVAAKALEEAVLLKINGSTEAEETKSVPFKIVLTETAEGIDWNTQFKEQIDKNVFDMLLKEVEVLTAYLASHGDNKHELCDFLWRFIRVNKLNCVGIEWKYAKSN